MEGSILRVRPEPEHWLETGFILLAGGILGTLAILLLGRMSEASKRKRSLAEHPPEIGDVSPESHQGILTVATT